MRSIDIRYALIRIDEHGTKFLIQAGCETHRIADEAMQALLAKQTKAHHQTYDILPYEIGTLAETLEQREIVRQ